MSANSDDLSRKIRLVYSILEQIKKNKVHKKHREPFEVFPEEEQISAALFDVLDYTESEALPWSVVSSIWDDEDPILCKYSMPSLVCWLFIRDPSIIYKMEG